VPFLLAERARRSCARSMRAVKDSLATPFLRERVEIRRRIKNPRWTRAVGDHQPPLLRKTRGVEESSIGKEFDQCAQ
jgi:hypothetical protein